MVTALRPTPGAPRSYRFPQFGDELLPNGVRLLTAPVTKVPLVTLLVLIDAGSANEQVGKEGVAGLTASALLEGTTRYDGAELAEKFERLGTALESGADWDSAFLKMTVLSDKLPEATRLLGEVMTAPLFPEREIERLKAERLAEILQQQAEPRGLADEKFSEFLYSSDSRYSKPDDGSANSVSSLTRADVEQFYRSKYGSGVTTVVLSGDIAPDAPQEIIMGALGKWQRGTKSKQEFMIAARANEKTAHVVNKPEASQSELRVGHVGLPRKHPDFFPTLVMNAVLGGLFGSRINLNLREVHGYTYGASSYFDWRRGPGPFVISTAVESDVTAPALREIFNEVDRIRSEPVSDQELSLAKDYLEGVFPIRYETTSAIASALGTLAIYGLPADYYDSYRRNINGITAEKVLTAARSHLHPERLQTVIVGDAEKIGMSLNGLDLGKITVHDA
ncbi:MAG: M16 family metallopeptidase [Gemmatimonadaceae bacterium]